MNNNYYKILKLDNFESDIDKINFNYKAISEPSNLEKEAYFVLTNNQNKAHYDKLLLENFNKSGINFKELNTNFDKAQDKLIDGLDKVILNSKEIFTFFLILMFLILILFGLFSKK